MVQMMARNWWIFALRGVIAILFGLALMFFAGPAIVVALFAAYLLLDGIFAIVHALSGRAGNPQWWVSLLEGVIGVIAGLIGFFYPGIAALSLVYVVSAWAILSGITEVYAAWHLRREISNEFLLGLAGIASIVFGVLAFLNPGAGLLTITTLISVYAIFFGVMLIGLGWRLRGMSTGATGARA